MEVEVVDEQVALVGGGGNDAIPLGPEVADGIQSGLGTTVVVKQSQERRTALQLWG